MEVEGAFDGAHFELRQEAAGFLADKVTQFARVLVAVWRMVGADKEGGGHEFEETIAVVVAETHAAVGDDTDGQLLALQFPVACLAGSDGDCRQLVAIDVDDNLMPGVLAQVASAFAEHDVSIETVRQQLRPASAPGGEHGAVLVIVTHRAPDAALSATVAALSELPVVREVASVLRVEGM